MTDGLLLLALMQAFSGQAFSVENDIFVIDSITEHSDGTYVDDTTKNIIMMVPAFICCTD